MRHLRWRLFLLVLAGLLATLSPNAANAAPPPTSLTIDSYARCFGSVLEQGDMLCVTQFETIYASCNTVTQTGCPTEIVTDTVLVSLLHPTTSAALKTVAPYALEEHCCNGYLKGIASVYFTAAESVTHGFDTTPMSDYSMSVGTNPTTVGVPVSDTLLIQSDDLTRTTLYQHIRARAIALETNWGLDLLDTVAGVDKLSITGATYFTNAIPRLTEMEHRLFIDVSVTPELDDKVFANTADTSARNFLQNAGGTAQIMDDNLIAAGGLLGLPGAVFKTFLAFIMAVALAAYVWHVTQNMVMGVSAFPLALAVLSAISLGTMGMVFLLAFLAVVSLVWVFFLKGA